MTFTEEEIVKILDKLVGKSTPIADSAIDAERFENLKTVATITEWCINRLADSAIMATSPYSSEQKNGGYAISKIITYAGMLSTYADEFTS